MRTWSPIPNLTDCLAEISSSKWTSAVTHLRRLRLLAKEDKEDPGGLDAHPLVRAYFGHRLKADFPTSWRDAHICLFKHLQDSAEPFPDTREGLEPLYRAMRHGIEAGQHQKAWGHNLLAANQSGRKRFCSETNFVYLEMTFLLFLDSSTKTGILK